MILLDTNILSAIMRQPPDAVVECWFDGQSGVDLWTTTVTVFEIRFGIARLPESRRRRRLDTAFSMALEEVLGGRVLPFDSAAAVAAAEIAAGQQADGRPVDFRDVQIAGIAKAYNARIATRNIRHFSDIGIDLINPWDDGDGF